MSKNASASDPSEFLRDRVKAARAAFAEARATEHPNIATSDTVTTALVWKLSKEVDDAESALTHYLDRQDVADKPKVVRKAPAKKPIQASFLGDATQPRPANRPAPKDAIEVVTANVTDFIAKTIKGPMASDLGRKVE